MAKISSVEKNKKRRKLVKQYAPKREALKEIVMNQDLPLDERFRAQLKLAALPRNSARNRVRNRCEITGRPRAYYRKLAELKPVEAVLCEGSGLQANLYQTLKQAGVPIHAFRKADQVADTAVRRMRA